jgi:hypothetical protein
MKTYLTIFTLLIGFHFSTFAQHDEPFTLSNVLVIAQQDELSDRYSIEVGLLQLFNQYNIQSMASLNVVKRGGSPDVLANDSVQTSLENKGIDTYLLVSVRGYNNRFSPSEELSDFSEELQLGHLFPLFRESATSVTFTFTFYRENKPVHYELIKIGSVGSTDAVMKKLLKKVNRRLKRDWAE